MVNDLVAIESTFCSDWKGWDQHDTLCLAFYEPTIHDHIMKKINDHFGKDCTVPYFDMDLDKMKVTFYINDDECVSFKILASVGEIV